MCVCVGYFSLAFVISFITSNKWCCGKLSQVNSLCLTVHKSMIAYLCTELFSSAMFVKIMHKCLLLLLLPTFYSFPWWFFFCSALFDFLCCWLLGTFMNVCKLFQIYFIFLRWMQNSSFLIRSNFRSFRHVICNFIQLRVQSFDCQQKEYNNASLICNHEFCYLAMEYYEMGWMFFCCFLCLLVLYLFYLL